MKIIEKQASREGDIETAEAANEKINELREKGIILKNLIIIEKNEEAVRFLLFHDGYSIYWCIKSALLWKNLKFQEYIWIFVKLDLVYLLEKG